MVPTGRAAAAALLIAVSGLAACGSDDEPASTTAAAGGGGAGGAGGGVAVPAESCPQPGDEGNENGVGRFCTPSGGECGDFPLAPVCLANFGQDQWMCTRIGCDETTDCGSGAGCLITDQGSACVPCYCDDSGIGCDGGAGAGGSGGSDGTGGAGGG